MARNRIPAKALASAAALGLAVAVAAGEAAPPAEAVFDVVQTVEVKDLPPGAREVRIWTWMPEDRPGQRVLDFRVLEAPPTLRVTRDPAHGRSWLYADAPASGEAPSRVVTSFRVRRSALRALGDGPPAGPVDAAHRAALARELRTDEARTAVTPALRRLADEVCGGETDPVEQARRLFRFVIDRSDHYSLSGPAPKGACLGDAMDCLEGTGDCCTDQHALFIALARARGIPCRLVFGSRLQPRNEGKVHDPGYRCWPLFFAPGMGWVPLDVSSGDAEPADPERWFGALDENRLEWAEGRDFDLEPRSAVRPDLVIGAWVEVDGRVHRGFTRTLRFTRR